MQRRRFQSVHVGFRMQNLSIPLVSLLIAALAATPYAAADTWDGGANNGGAWSTNNNWADNTEPTSADAVIFPTPIPLGDSSIALSSGEQCASITFNDN